MRVLYITNNYLKGGSGAIYASKSFVNTFAESVDELTVLYPYKENFEATDINPRVKLVPVVDSRSKLKKIFDWCLGTIHRYENVAILYFDSKQYDVVVFDSSIVSFHLIRKAKAVGLKCITIHHNYQMEFVKDDTPWYLLPIMLIWTYFSEKEAVKNSNLNLTLTQTDAKSLKMHYDLNGKFEVLGVCDYLHKNYKEESQKNNVGYNFVITGQLASIQTEKSLIPWLEIYFPILKEICPDASLVVAGRSPSNRLKKKCNELGVTIIPSPESMKPILNNGDYFICPTSLGSGLKLRNMDGLRVGMQILTHEKSARGYEEMIDAGVMYVYNDIDSFKHKLSLMLQSTKSRQDVLDVYKSYFSLDSGITRLDSILQNLKI